MSQDLWDLGQGKEVTLMHVTGHSPLMSPGNDEAEALAQIWWLEWDPTTDAAHWLHRKLQHAKNKTMWQVNRCWGLPLKLQGIADACHNCVVCDQDKPQQ